MSEKSDASFQKARDEALRALVRGGLTPDQVSTLKLNEVHLATGTLVMEPDEFDTSASAGERPIKIKLDAEIQRALISWLVVRPDGPNNHLFPGAGTSGLDVASINQVVAPKKPAEAPKGAGPVETRAPEERPEAFPESVPPRPPEVKEEAAPPPSPPPPVTTQREEREAVPLDEIESLRQRLADSYDAWGPAVTAATARRVVEPPPRQAVPPSPPLEAEAVDAGAAPVKAPVGPPEAKPEPSEPPPPEPQEAVVAEPAEEALVPVPAPAPSGGLGGKLRGWWNLSGEKATFNLSYRAVALGGLALALVVCCVGLVFAGGTMMGLGPAGLVAGATPTATLTPTQTALPATSTPTPTVAATSTPTATPSATPTATPGPTSTQAPTSTPVVIVVTATATPEPTATETRLPTETPEGGVPPEPTATETPGFKYAAPILVWPEDGSVAPGIINILQWEPVGTLADEEWYTTRLVFRQQGQLVYEGDRVKIPEWRVPDRLYYAADGPDLKYSWYVFVERDNPEGSTTQLSPDSETFVFRWE
jgi:hypothetical protein